MRGLVVSRLMIHIGVSILAIQFGLTLMTGDATAESARGVVAEGSYDSHFLGAVDSTDDMEIHFTCDRDVDLYLISEVEMGDYRSGQRFSPVWKRESVMSANEIVEPDGDGRVYLVVDNLDNARSSDQLPSGDAEYELTWDIDPALTDTEMNICCALMVIIPVISLVLIVWLFMHFRKKRSMDRSETERYRQAHYGAGPVPPGPVPASYPPPAGYGPPPPIDPYPQQPRSYPPPAGGGPLPPIDPHPPQSRSYPPPDEVARSLR